MEDKKRGRPSKGDTTRNVYLRGRVTQELKARIDKVRQKKIDLWRTQKPDYEYSESEFVRDACTYYCELEEAKSTDGYAFYRSVVSWLRSGAGPTELGRKLKDYKKTHPEETANYGKKFRRI